MASNLVAGKGECQVVTNGPYIRVQGTFEAIRRGPTSNSHHKTFPDEPANQDELAVVVKISR